MLSAVPSGRMLLLLSAAVLLAAPSSAVMTLKKEYFTDAACTTFDQISRDFPISMAVGASCQKGARFTSVSDVMCDPASTGLASNPKATYKEYQSILSNATGNLAVTGNLVCKDNTDGFPAAVVYHSNTTQSPGSMMISLDTCTDNVGNYIKYTCVDVTPTPLPTLAATTATKQVVKYTLWEDATCNTKSTRLNPEVLLTIQPECQRFGLDSASGVTCAVSSRSAYVKKFSAAIVGGSLQENNACSEASPYAAAKVLSSNPADLNNWGDQIELGVCKADSSPGYWYSYECIDDPSSTTAGDGSGSGTTAGDSAAARLSQGSWAVLCLALLAGALARAQ
mmetsp:Transcript_28265/g.69907  ORF Transcript_28265/g.69907 Transcript_28265/m.69907 type:complete len:338 (-) Transcript_28265:278-1291(-)